MNATPIVLDVLLALALLWPAARYGRAMFHRGVRLGAAVDVSSAPGLIALSFAFIIANPILLSVRSYPAWSWYLPVIVEYWNVPALWLVNVATIAFAFGAIFTLALLSRSPYRWFLPVVCAALLGGAEHLFRSSALVSVPELARPQISEGGVIMQTSGSSCAAVACANIAGLLGTPKSEADMVALLGTTVAGTSPGQVVYGMRELGFSCKKRMIPDRDITRIRPPAVVFVNLSTEIDGHAVALMRVKDGRAEIWDPSFGKSLREPNDFAKTWGGRAVEISR